MISGVVLQVEILHILWRNLDNPLQQVVKYSPPRDSAGIVHVGFQSVFEIMK